MDKLINKLRLNSFQQKALFGNPEKYDLNGLVRKGVLVYAPLANQGSGCLAGKLSRFFHGPKADLIGEDKILVSEQRGIKLYRTGFYRARDKDGRRYYADSTGKKLSHYEFYHII